MRNFARYLIDAIGNRFTPSDFATASSVSGKANLVSGIHPANESRGSALSYNATTGEITLTGANGQTSIVNLPVELLLQSANYNSTTKTLTLTTNGGATVEVPLTDLVDLPEIQIATQDPVANPTTGQRAYFRSDTGRYWIASGGAWNGPFPNAATVGLGNVDNTSDEDKPISSAVQTAILNHTHSQYGDLSESNNWALQQTFDVLFGKITKLACATVTGSDSWPAGNTILFSNIASSEAVINCSDYTIPGEETCLGVSVECSWLDPETLCEDQMDAFSCNGLDGCEWNQEFCEDFGNSTQCEAQAACTWDSETGVCNGGAYFSECTGTPEALGCSGEIPVTNIGYVDFMYFSDKQVGIVRNIHSTDALELKNDESVFHTVPVGGTAIVIRDNGTMKVVLE